MISESERARRRRAVASSEASLAIEGEHLDAASRDLNRRYIAGEITTEEFSQGLERHAFALAASLREEQNVISA